MTAYRDNHEIAKENETLRRHLRTVNDHLAGQQLALQQIRDESREHLLELRYERQKTSKALVCGLALTLTGAIWFGSYWFAIASTIIAWGLAD